MRVTIFGATGLLGKSLMKSFAGDEVIGLGSKDADIRDGRGTEDVVKQTRPDWIVLAAAYADVDGCETDPERAFAVNTKGAINVALSAKACGARLLFVSSDYVFDGAKTTPYESADIRAPRSTYGRSKADAEVMIAQDLPQACIVRTSWLFGMGGPCFPEAILKLAATRGEIEVVDDQRGSPTLADDAAGAIAQLCRLGASGIVHVTNRGDCTRFEFARAIISATTLATIVRPTTSDRFVRPAARPKYSVLSPHSLDNYGVAMPSWQDALSRYMARARPKATNWREGK